MPLLTHRLRYCMRVFFMRTCSDITHKITNKTNFQVKNTGIPGLRALSHPGLGAGPLCPWGLPSPRPWHWACPPGRMSSLPHPVLEAWRAQATLHAQLDTDPSQAPHSPYFPIWKKNAIMIAPVSEPGGRCFGGYFGGHRSKETLFPLTDSN